MVQQIIKAELLLIGINGAKMRKILADEYDVKTSNGKPVSESTYSMAITGARNDPLSVKIREKCMEYIRKQKSKE